MTLDQAPRGLPLHVVTAGNPNPAVTRRLAELGVRPGVRLSVRARTSGGGAILAIGDDRIAVARSILIGVQVERIERGDG